MQASNDDELPGCTLPGAQDKLLAVRTEDGRYVVQSRINTAPIASWPVRVRDARPLQDFKNEPGPPSIIDMLVTGRRKA